jgi:hypothetical protein
MIRSACTVAGAAVTVVDVDLSPAAFAPDRDRIYVSSPMRPLPLAVSLAHGDCEEHE